MPDFLQRGRSSSRNIRGLELFRAIGRRISRQNKVDKSDGSGSSSPGSQQECSCNTESSDSQDADIMQQSNEQHCFHHQVNFSDKSDNNERNSIDKLTAMLRGLKIQRSSPKKSKKQKSIIRKPVRYAHFRGISGLPTLRIPVSSGYYQQPRSPIH